MTRQASGDAGNRPRAWDQPYQDGSVQRFVLETPRFFEPRAAADEKAAAAAASGEPVAEAKPKKSKKKGKPKKVTEAPLPMIDEAPVEEADELGWWNKALVLAGLDPYEMTYEKGVSFPNAISYYIDACSLLPSSHAELKRFAKEANFGLSRPSVEHGAKIALYLPAVAELRSAQGLAMVCEIASTKAKPTFDLSKLPSDLPKPAPGRDFWANNPDAVIDALCDYLDTLAPRHEQAATRGDYERQQHAGRSSIWPSASTLGRVSEKSFSKWIARAEPEWQKRLASKAASKQQAA